MTAPDKVQVVKFVLWVKDMKRAIAFYRNNFGLDLKFRSENWSELAHGDAIVALHGGRTGGAVKTGLSFQVANAAAACAQVADTGGQIVKAPSLRPGEPILLADVRDPDGNEFMVTQYMGS